MSEESYYISTEIIVKSKSKCEPFVRELVSDDATFYIKPSSDESEWYLCIAPVSHENAEVTMQAICDSIEGLSDEARLEWEEAHYKEFYIGYRISENTPYLAERLSNSTIQRVSNLGAGIGIAMYSMGLDED